VRRHGEGSNPKPNPHRGTPGAGLSRPAVTRPRPAGPFLDVRAGVVVGHQGGQRPAVAVNGFVLTGRRRSQREVGRFVEQREFGGVVETRARVRETNRGAVADTYGNGDPVEVVTDV